MKPNNHMKKNLFILLLSCFLFGSTKGQEIDITYDYGAVKKLIEILDKGVLLDNDFNALMQLNGSKAYLKKMATFFSGIDESSFKKSLEAATKGTPIENDPFMFQRVLKSVPNAKKLLAKVMVQEKELTKNSISLLAQYTPKNTKIEATVYMILGITGGGWTFDDDPNSFYVDFSSLKDDVDGLTYLSAHELFHLIQYRFMNPVITKSEKVGYLLDQMLREGSATYVADFTKLSSTGFYVDFSKKDYERNFRRMEGNFALFEALIYQAHHSPDSDIDQLYNIGLSGMYQSPLYYVGYHMIRLIEKYGGREEVISLLKQTPDQLILAYDKLCVKHKNGDNDFISLSKTTTEILHALKK